MRIFILEDDTSLRQGISLKLSKEGHEVSSAPDAASAGAYIQRQFDFAILDVNLPDGSGLEICKAFRAARPAVHILILTANDAETDIVMGYELGADDYMTKPFSLSVLLSKINATRRRIDGTANEQPLPLGFDPLRQTIVVGGETVPLTRNEARLLDVFLHNIGQILTKEQLMQTLWGLDGDFVDSNTLAVNIQRLRSKLSDGYRLIESIRGVGYRFNGERL